MRTSWPAVPVLCFVGMLCGPTALPAQERAPGSTPRGVTLLEAATSTLQLHPLLQAQQKQVDISRAVRQQTSAEFDTRLLWSADHKRSNSPLTESARLSLRQAGFDIASESLNLTTVTGAFSRLFRSGIVIGPRLEVVRSAGNLQNVDGASRTRFSFDLNVPLQRGRGRDVVTARETSSELNVAASLFDLNQTAADVLLATATDYWEYVGAVKRLEIVSGSEARAREYVESVGLLIEADKIPRSEIFQVRANLAGRTADRISVEQQLAEARYALGLAMGLGPGQVHEIPLPSDAFPDGPISEPSASPAAVQSYIDMALASRADYQAAEKRKQAADVIKRTSRNSLRPQLDLMVSSGFAGLQEGRGPGDFLDSLYTSARGPDLLFGLRYSRPVSNNLAHGQVAEAEASHQQAALLSSQKAREIAAGVASSLVSVYHGIQRLEKGREAVALYQSALEGEKDKLRLAVGSLTDLLTVEGRLTSALVDLVAAQEAYAIALVRFRHATGTLVPADAAVHSIERDVFFTTPAVRPPQ